MGLIIKPIIFSGQYYEKNIYQYNAFNHLDFCVHNCC